MELQ
jgi:hypothetical protein